MNATITSVGGRAPPGRKTRTLSAGSRSPGAAPDSRARARAAAAARPSSGPRAGRRPAHAAAPTSAASRPYTRSSPRSIRSPPIASRARPAAPTPAAPPAPAPPVRTRSVVPWLHPLKSWSLRQSRGGSTTDGEPALRTICAAAGIDRHLLLVHDPGPSGRAYATRRVGSDPSRDRTSANESPFLLDGKPARAVVPPPDR